MDGTADNRGNHNLRQDVPESPSSSSTTVLAALQLYPLLDMTAFEHGKSTITASQSKRIARANHNASSDHGSSNKKSKISEKKQDSAKVKPDEIQPKTIPGGKKNDSDPSFFAMEQWPVDEFQLFLDSVNEELNELGQVNLGEYSKAIQSHLKESMKCKTIPTESFLDCYLQDRFSALEFFLNESGKVGTTCFQTKQAVVDHVNFPDIKAGPHHAVDFIFARRSDQNDTRPAVCLWENKVSWNFPGGSLTSATKDFARLGRDVPLHELLSGKLVSSMADDATATAEVPASAAAAMMANADEGECFEADIDPTEVDSAELASSSPTDAGLGIEGTYKMDHDVFPPRRLVTYLLSYKAKYGILSTGYRIDFCRLVTTTCGDKKTITLQIAGPYTTSGYRRMSIMNTTDRDRNWSTKILDYAFLEGLTRFLLASTKLIIDPGSYGALDNNAKEEDTRDKVDEPAKPQPSGRSIGGSTGDGETIEKTGSYSKWSTSAKESSAATESSTADAADCSHRSIDTVDLPSPKRKDEKSFPRSYLRDKDLPSWYDDWMGKRKMKRPDVPESCLTFQTYGEAVEYCMSTNKDTPGWADWEYFERSAVVLFAESGKELELDAFKRGIGLTRFGPLTYYDLSKEEESAADEGKVIGYGRIGPAIRKVVDKVDLVCKVLYEDAFDADVFMEDGFDSDEFTERIEELKHEMTIYHRLVLLQGSVVPKFLYAGALTDPKHFIIPELAHVYGLATSWEGEMFVSGSVSNEAKEAAREGLKQIHSCGVLHGDLEARNLVVRNNRITFIDFGNARCQEECLNQWQSLCEKEDKRLESLLRFT
jgi:hypothetical protein